MKRFCSIFLLTVLICCVMISPAMAAGESMTDPVEIIDSTTPTEPPTPTDPSEAKGPNPLDISDSDVPLATNGDGSSGASWSLVNLVCAVLTTAFGGAATAEGVKINRNKKDLSYGNEKYTILRKEKTRTENGEKITETEYVRKNRLWKSGMYDLVSSAASVGTFALTENLSNPMSMIDKWTPLMLGILAVGAGVYGVTASGKKLDKDLAEKILESDTTTAGV